MVERIVHPSTSEEDARLNALAARIETEGPEMAARLERMERAEREPGVRGELRRAIRDALVAPRRLAEATGVDVDLIRGFQEGRADLPSADLERLAGHFGLTVVLTATV